MTTFLQLDADLARDVSSNTLRYVEMFARAVDELKPEPDGDVCGGVRHGVTGSPGC